MNRGNAGSDGNNAISGSSSGSGPGRHSVIAAAKRRGISRTDRSSAGGGGRGRTSPKDRAAVKELSVVLQEGGRQRGGSGSGSGNGSNGNSSAGGFGQAKGGARRRDRRGGSGAEQRRGLDADLEGEADWDEELLADLSDSGERGRGMTVGNDSRE